MATNGEVVILGLANHHMNLLILHRCRAGTAYKHELEWCTVEAYDAFGAGLLLRLPGEEVYWAEDRSWKFGYLPELESGGERHRFCGNCRRVKERS